MPTPRFDSTITWGNILTAVTFLVAALAGWASMSSDVRVLAAEQRATRAEMVKIEQRVDAMSALLAADARRETELAELRRRLEIFERQVEALRGR